jgi:hypothetical protein
LDLFFKIMRQGCVKNFVVFFDIGDCCHFVILIGVIFILYLFIFLINFKKKYRFRIVFLCGGT